MSDLSKRMRTLDVCLRTTPRPWTIDAPGCIAKHFDEGGKSTVAVCGHGGLTSAEDRGNASLIVEYVGAVPALCAEIDSLEKMIEKIKQTIRDGIECANASGHSEFERRLMVSTLSMTLFQIENVI